ncbi:MAG TPA: ribonuclease Z [Bacteroidales bacterium]|nr:ribonuclease Z [Bacteroidales bacterium]
MKLTILGSSSALPTSARNPSAHVLNVHERLFLIDCGEGTQMQMRRFRIRFGKINHIFISHIHGDHVFGLYGLLSTFSLMGRQTPLHIYAPANYEKMFISHLNDFDIYPEFDIVFQPLEGKKIQTVLEDKHLTVKAFPLRHRIPSFGFLFREKEELRKIVREMIVKHNIPVSKIPGIKKGEDFVKDDGTVIRNEDLTIPPPKPRTYAYCSDTSYFSRLPSYLKEVDILYHEATFGDDHADLAPLTGHSTASEAAKVAAAAGVKKLLIGHFSSRYKDAGVLLEQARKIFPETFIAEEGVSYNI